MDGTDTVFTLTNAGRYYISYNVNFTAGLLISSRLLINGIVNADSVRSPGITVNSLHGEIILTLAANSTVTLQLFGLLGAATLQSGQGSTLTMIRLDN